MNNAELLIKNLIERYVNEGDIRNLDKAEKLYNEKKELVTMTWEQLCEGK
jgi:hypothetical protein